MRKRNGFPPVVEMMLTADQTVIADPENALAERRKYLRDGIVSEREELIGMFGAFPFVQQDRAIGLIESIIGRAAHLGALSLDVPAVKKVKVRNGAAEMRAVKSKRKRESAKEIALRDAIRAQCGSGPIEKPWKEADAIFSMVNQHLASLELPAVSKDSIYDRLKSWPS